MSERHRLLNAFYRQLFAVETDAVHETLSALSSPTPYKLGGCGGTGHRDMGIGG